MTRSRPPVRPLISERRLRARVRVLGRRIGREYRGKELILVGVLKGSFIFMADLAREIGIPLTCDFLRVSSYGGARTSGSVRFEFDLTQPVKGKHVVLVEDIVDTGLTMEYLLENLRTRHPASVKLCALLHKPDRAVKQIPIDYLGFTIPDLFVIGYGLDYAQRYRNLPFIGVLE